MSELAAIKANVHGRVQGVNFRYFVEKHANALDLTGYVKNLQGGRDVEVYAEGKRDALEKLIECLYKGPSRAVIERVDLKWFDYGGTHKSFRVCF